MIYSIQRTLPQCNIFFIIHKTGQGSKKGGPVGSVSGDEMNSFWILPRFFYYVSFFVRLLAARGYSFLSQRRNPSYPLTSPDLPWLLVLLLFLLVWYLSVSLSVSLSVFFGQILSVIGIGIEIQILSVSASVCQKKLSSKALLVRRQWVLTYMKWFNG